MNIFLSKLIPHQLHPSFIVKQTIIKSTSNKICCGPFSGMEFGSLNISLKYLCGNYELELSPLIEKLCEESFDTIVNVGAAFGYYAVGMALRNPRAQVIAFEKDDEPRNLMKEIASLNKIEDRLEIQGLCDASTLSDSIKTGSNCVYILD